MPRYYELRAEATLVWERKVVTQALEAHGWSVNGTARYLGIDRSNMQRMIRRLGLVRPVKVCEKCGRMPRKAR